MNERILSPQLLKLVQVAGPGYSLADPEWVKKFAELIVHRMLDITNAHTEVFQTDRDRALIEHIKKSVTQHFGVEE